MQQMQQDQPQRERLLPQCKQPVSGKYSSGHTCGLVKLLPLLATATLCKKCLHEDQQENEDQHHLAGLQYPCEITDHQNKLLYEV